MGTGAKYRTAVAGLVGAGLIAGSPAAAHTIVSPSSKAGYRRFRRRLTEEGTRSLRLLGNQPARPTAGWRPPSADEWAPGDALDRQVRLPHAGDRRRGEAAALTGECDERELLVHQLTIDADGCTLCAMAEERIRREVSDQLFSLKLWRPVEWLFNTPSHHRVHHGSNNVYLDRNYGGILIVWHRLFRTFEPEGERVVYGLTKNIDTYNPLRVAFHEYAAAWHDVRGVRCWRDKAGYLFGPPGWSPKAGV